MVSIVVGSGSTTTQAGSWYDRAGSYGSACSTEECEARTNPLSIRK
jgi:hypothetical protein